MFVHVSVFNFVYTDTRYNDTHIYTYLSPQICALCTDGESIHSQVSHLLINFRSGSHATAKAMIEDVLTIRADRGFAVVLCFYFWLEVGQTV